MKQTSITSFFPVVSVERYQHQLRWEHDPLLKFYRTKEIIRVLLDDIVLRARFRIRLTAKGKRRVVDNV